jgi:hypothetical protein
VANEGVFEVRGERTRSEFHILGFLEFADRLFPDLALRERHDGLLLFGGWTTSNYRKLSALNRGDVPCFADIVTERGFGSARLDLAVCLALPPR